LHFYVRYLMPVCLLILLIPLASLDPLAPLASPILTPLPPARGR
jgi:hypothetical protein